MSKIADALRRTQGEVAPLALQIIDSAGNADTANRRGTVSSPQTLDPTKLLSSDLGSVRFEELRADRLGRIVVHSQPTSSAADKFRLLRMRLRDLWASGKLKSILISSALPRDGKTTVAMNLATVLIEERSRKVLLIDADLHRGALDEELGLLPQSGLSECLHEGVPPISVIRRIEPLGWHYLSSGKMRSQNLTEVLQPRAISGLVQALSHHFDWIVVDSPPVLAVSDGVALANHMDGTLLVARAGVTPVKAIEDAIGLLGKQQVLGLLLNGVETTNRYASSYQSYRGRKPSPTHAEE